MQIAFDACQAGFQPRAGIPHYVHQLLGALVQLDHTNSYTIFYKRGHDLPAHTANSNVDWRPLRCPANHAFWSQVRLPLALAQRRFDVVHVPAHRVPWVTGGRLVTTIHDLVFLKHPETLRAGHRQRLVWYTRQAVRRSARLIAISEATKREVCELYGVAPENIDVVPHGLNHDLFRPTAPLKREHPYILAVGTLQPRKNYVTLIRAFKRLRAPVELLIAGQRGWLSESIEKEAETTDRVRLLGYVPDHELPALYAGATLVAMPSLYEGFGLPLVEAMACGAPLIASNIAAFTEAAGDAAVFVNSTDVEAWAETMRALLDDSPRREQLRQSGLDRSQNYSWERAARETIATYEKVARQ